MNEEPAVGPETGYVKPDGTYYMEPLIPMSKARKMAKDARRQGRRDEERGRVDRMSKIVARVSGDYATYTNECQPFVPSGVTSGTENLHLNASHGDGCAVVRISHAGDTPNDFGSFVASSRCHPDDTDDAQVGLNLAAARALFDAAEYFFGLANQHATCHLRAPWAKKGD